MKIAYILPSLKQVGPIIVARDIIDHLPEDFGPVDVFYFKGSPEITFARNGIRFRKISIFSQISFANYDIAHSHCIWSDIFLSLKPKSKKVRFISTMHNYIEQDLVYRRNIFFAKIGSFLWRLSLKRFDRVVVLSQHMASYYRNSFFQLKNLTIIYNGRTPIPTETENAEDASKLEALKIKSKIIGMVCGLNKRKGIDIALLSLRRLKDFTLVIIGEGPEKAHLISLAKTIGVDDRCYFLGYKKDPFSYYKYFDIFLLPSRSEGFPLALIEAAALGVPIVASKLPVLEEVFSEKEIGTADILEENAVSEKVKFVFEERLEFAKNAKKRQSENYTAEAMSVKYQNLYETL